MTTPRHRPEVLATPVDSDFLLLDRQEGVLHRLNETASFVWTRCDGVALLSDVARELAGVYDVSVDAAERDVAEIVERLTALGALESSGSAIASGV